MLIQPCFSVVCENERVSWANKAAVEVLFFATEIKYEKIKAKRKSVSYTNKQYSCWLLLACGKAFYCCARAVQESEG